MGSGGEKGMEKVSQVLTASPHTSRSLQSSDQSSASPGRFTSLKLLSASSAPNWEEKVGPPWPSSDSRLSGRAGARSCVRRSAPHSSLQPPLPFSVISARAPELCAR